MPRFDAASISITSSEVPAAISLHESQSPQGSGVGHFTQFMAFARILAAVVFPTARPGENIRVRHAVVPDCICEPLRDVLLSDKIAEGLRTPLAGYDLVAHLE